MAAAKDTKKILAALREASDQGATVHALLTRQRRFVAVELALRQKVLAPLLPLTDAASGKTNLSFVHIAAQHGAAGVVRCLIKERGLDANTRTATGWTPLHCAIDKQQEKCALVLLREIPEVDIFAEPARLPGWTPMAFAASRGMVGVIRQLVDKGADVNAPIRIDGEDAHVHGGTALHRVIAGGHEQAVLQLLDKIPGVVVNVNVNVNVNAVSGHGTTPLMLAGKYNMVHAARALVARGADVEVRDNDGMTALDYAAKGKQELAVLCLLEEMGASPYTFTGKSSMLYFAARHGMARTILALVRRMRMDGQGEAALVDEMEQAAGAAIATGHVAALAALAEAGLDLTTARARPPSSSTGIELLFLACQVGSQESAAFLVRQKCDPLKASASGVLCHHLAASQGHWPLVRWLMTEWPALPSKALPPLLYMAAMQGNMAAAEFLIGQGVDPRQTYQSKGVEQRPSDVAGEKGHLSVWAYLRQQETQAAADEAMAEEARVRRLRNERRRQKQKRALARKQSSSPLSETPPPPPPQQQANAVESSPSLEEYLDADLPDALRCPISLVMFEDPVLLAADGHTYSRNAIEEHLDYCRENNKPPTSPMTNEEMEDPAQARLYPNMGYRSQVAEYVQRKTREWEQLTQR